MVDGIQIKAKTVLSKCLIVWRMTAYIFLWVLKLLIHFEENFEMFMFEHGLIVHLCTSETEY